MIQYNLEPVKLEQLVQCPLYFKAWALLYQTRPQEESVFTKQI